MYFFFMIAIIIGTYFILKLDTHQATPALQILGLFKVVYLTGVPALVLIFRFNQAKKTDEWLVKQDYAEIYFQQFKSQIK
jgi:TRAP-type C4-dicarboxylate transport system permease small subunit